MTPESLAAMELTELLHAWRAGLPGAAEALTRWVYPELRRVAAALRRRERSDLTLDPTEIVHEAWMALDRSALPHWQDRMHFFGVAVRTMRQLLVAHARRRHRHKRGAGPRRVALDEMGLPAGGSPVSEVDLLALDQALRRLEDLDPLAARVVELRFFGGLSIDEVAALTGLGRATVVRKWRAARAWLRRLLVDA